MFAKRELRVRSKFCIQERVITRACSFEILNLNACSNLLVSSTVLGAIQLKGIKVEYNPSNMETIEIKKFLRLLKLDNSQCFSSSFFPYSLSQSSATCTITLPNRKPTTNVSVSNFHCKCFSPHKVTCCGRGFKPFIPESG